MLRQAASAPCSHLVKLIRKNSDGVSFPSASDSADSASLWPSLNPVLLWIPHSFNTHFTPLLPFFPFLISDFTDPCLCLLFPPSSHRLEAPENVGESSTKEHPSFSAFVLPPPPFFSVPPLDRSPLLLLSSPRACRGLDHCASLRAEMESANSVLISAQLNQVESGRKGATSSRRRVQKWEVTFCHHFRRNGTAGN